MKFKDTRYGDLTEQVYDGDIDVSFMNITSLEGAPKIVKGNFYACKNLLNSLMYAPEEVYGNFKIFMNEGITSLVHGPKIVTGNYSCFSCNIDSLKGAPEEVGRSFDCSANINLESLKYSPKKVHKHFDCSFTSISNFKHMPDYVREKIVALSLYKLKSFNGLNTNNIEMNDVVIEKAIELGEYHLMI